MFSSKFTSHCVEKLQPWKPSELNFSTEIRNSLKKRVNFSFLKNGYFPTQCTETLFS